MGGVWYNGSRWISGLNCEGESGIILRREGDRMEAEESLEETEKRDLESYSIRRYYSNAKRMKPTE